MKSRQQELQLKLRETTLLVYRSNNAGTRSLNCKWEIRESGTIPRALFYLLRNAVQYRVRECDQDSEKALRRAVLAGLISAAESCGCEPLLLRAGGDVTFFLGDQPLIAFEIAKNATNYKPSRELLHSEAVFRWSVKIHKNGFVEFVPQKSNPEWRA